MRLESDVRFFFFVVVNRHGIIAASYFLCFCGGIYRLKFYITFPKVVPPTPPDQIGFYPPTYLPIHLPTHASLSRRLEATSTADLTSRTSLLSSAALRISLAVVAPRSPRGDSTPSCVLATHSTRRRLLLIPNAIDLAQSSRVTNLRVERHS